MNNKTNRSLGRLWAVLALVVLVPVGFVLIKRLEGTPPNMHLELTAPTVGANQSIPLHVEDTQSGIRQVRVVIAQEGQEKVLLERTFPAGGLLSGGAVRQEALSVPLDVKQTGFKDGPATLRLLSRDFSWRQWGKGNLTHLDQNLIIDTRPPVVEVISQAHNLNQGGAALVIYRLSEACRTSGVTVGDNFYPGMTGPFSDPNIHMTFFALSHLQGPGTVLQVTAVDLAGNQGRVGLAHHINARRFKKDRIAVTDEFLNAVMPAFQPEVASSAADNLLDVFLKVNRDLRVANDATLLTLTAKSEPKLYWQGPFLQLPRSANRAGFADHRTYTYAGKVIDEQYHLGVDLASLQQSPVPAGNTGKVVFADYIGIYGNTVVLDHGFGLFSIYSHLSQMDVTPGQVVQKGDIIAKTGRTGLAVGDHLHYSMLVHQTFVNPLEWWDGQWIENNITAKLTAMP